jgi:hypothetical protein
MPNEGDTEYKVLREWFSKELSALDGQVILVGHSAGGAILLWISLVCQKGELWEK